MRTDVGRMVVARGARFVEDSGSVLLPAVVFAQVVGIHAADADRLQLAAAVEGCNQALGDDRCGAQAAETTEPSWVAELRWLDDERRRAHVRLTRSDEQGVEVVTRDVEFDADDPLEHRYRALGLIVAAYVIASGAEGTRSHDGARAGAPGDRAPNERASGNDSAHAVTPPAASPASPVSRPRDVPDSAAARGCDRDTDTWGLDGAVVGNVPRDATLPRLGAALKPWWRFCDRPLLALGQLRWTRSDAEPLQVDFLSGSLGLGVHLPASALPLALELRGEVVGERAMLRAEEASSDRREQAGAWRLGARAGADVVVQVVGGWAVFVGGELSVLRPRLVVEVAGEPAGREPSLGVSGLAGLRWQLLR